MGTFPDIYSEVMMWYAEGTLTSSSGQQIKKSDDFKYLGSWTSSTAKDLKVRKGQEWAALFKLDKICHSQTIQKTKNPIFQSHRRKCAIVRLGVLDTNKNSGKSPRWLLHQTSTSRSKYKMATEG